MVSWENNIVLRHMGSSIAAVNPNCVSVQSGDTGYLRVGTLGRTVGYAAARIFSFPQASALGYQDRC